MQPNNNITSSVQTICGLTFQLLFWKQASWGPSETQLHFQFSLFLFYLNTNRNKNNQDSETLKDRPALLCPTDMTSVIKPAVAVSAAAENL